jgi:hypothetical protein
LVLAHQEVYDTANRASSLTPTDPVFPWKRESCTVPTCAAHYIQFTFIHEHHTRNNHIVANSGLEFYESSAKENINVTPIFERLVDLICDKMSKSLDSNATILNNPQTKRLTAPTGGLPGMPGGASLTNMQAACQQC